MHPLFSKTWVHGPAAAMGGRLPASTGFGMHCLLSADTSKKPAVLFDMDGLEERPFSRHGSGLSWSRTWSYHADMDLLDYLVLVAYFVLMIWLGRVAMRRVKAQEDYFMGGRQFGKLVQAFAAFGAGTGSSDPVNTARTSFTSGMSGIWSTMSWLFVTPFYWLTGVWYRRMRHITLGDWYVERYESKAMGAAYTLFGILFYMVYGSMLFSAIGKVAAPLLGNTMTLGGTTVQLEYVLVPLIAVIVIIYGVLGGLTAAYWTDMVQGIFNEFVKMLP